MMELDRKHATNIYNTRSLIRTLTYVLDILQTEEVFTVEEYKHTHTQRLWYMFLSISINQKQNIVFEAKLKESFSADI